MPPPDQQSGKRCITKVRFTMRHLVPTGLEYSLPVMMVSRESGTLAPTPSTEWQSNLAPTIWRALVPMESEFLLSGRHASGMLGQVSRSVRSWDGSCVGSTRGLEIGRA